MSRTTAPLTTATTATTATPDRTGLSPSPGRRAGAARVAVVMAGPVLLAASELLAPRFPDGLDTAGEGAFLVAHRGLFTAASLLGSLAGVLLAVSVVLVAVDTSGRGRRLVRTAAASAVIAGTGLTMHHAATLGGLDAMAGGVPPESLVAMAEGPGSAVSILGLVVGTTLTTVLLGVAAHRTGRTPGRVGWWPLAVAVLGVAANLSGIPGGTVVLVVALGVLLAVHLRPAPDAARP